jgi:DNA uptake protein ComE-like DNA-binding protein
MQDQARAIDLNVASEEDLAQIAEIGPLCAHQIVEYRRVNGRFVSMRELRYIDGLAQKALGDLLRTLRV